MLERFLESVGLTYPELMLPVLPALVVLAWLLVFRTRRNSYALTGLEYLRTAGCIRGKSRKLLRATLWSVVLILLGMLWADPVFYSPRPLFLGGEQTLHKNFIVALDMSPSMNLPVEFRGFGGKDLLAGDAGTTRYETARQALFDFLERFEGERFGLVLFSTEPFLARWPTVETGSKFMEILGDTIRRGSGTQLEAFSSLTNIDKALELARNILSGEEGAIILISDAEDDLENLGAAVRNLRENDIRLYTIGVGVPEEIVDKLSREFAHDPGFRIFLVDSEEDMREAYRLVGEVEESSLFAREDSGYQTRLRWLLCLLLAVITGVLVWLDQTSFHRSTNSHAGQNASWGRYHGF